MINFDKNESSISFSVIVQFFIQIIFGLQYHNQSWSNFPNKVDSSFINGNVVLFGNKYFCKPIHEERKGTYT